MSHFPAQKQSLVTRQDVFYVLTLMAICLLFCLVPKHSFGQPPLGLIGTDAIMSLDAPFNPEPAPATLEQAPPEPLVPFSPPVPAVAEASPAIGNQFPPMLPSQPQPSQPLQQQSVQQHTLQQHSMPQHSMPQSMQREVAVNVEHPFRQYWGTPNTDSITGQTRITGKPMTVAELFAGTRSSAVRTRLLQTYWELSGLLAIYHFRCEAERQASGAAGQQQDMMALLREQRRTAEMEFIKQQWRLAELLRQYKGRTLQASELPIPADYPLYPRYQTHADRIARTERTRYLGRMIPIQEQLIETKNGSWQAASSMVPSASQPFFVVSNQRTMAFLDLTRAIVDYNKMIAEYALETIPPNVSPQQLVGAVVRLPRSNAVLEQPQTLQTATEGIRLTRHEAPVGVASQPMQLVAHEFQREELQWAEYQSALPSPPMPTVIETEEQHQFEPSPPSFLMDY